MVDWKVTATTIYCDAIDFVGGKIARYKKPHFIQFVSSLPKDEAGFIDREKVKAIYGVE